MVQTIVRCVLTCVHPEGLSAGNTRAVFRAGAAQLGHINSAGLQAVEVGFEVSPASQTSPRHQTQPLKPKGYARCS